MKQILKKKKEKRSRRSKESCFFEKMTPWFDVLLRFGGSCY